MSKPYSQYAPRFLLCFLLIFSLDVLAFDDINESVYFPAVAQGHHGDNNNTCHKVSNPQFEQHNSARINGTLGNNLKFCSNNAGDGLPDDGCDTASGGDRYCSVTRGDIRGLKTKGGNAFKYSNENGGGIDWCSSGDEYLFGDDRNTQFGKIQAYSACTVTFSTNHSEYRIKNILIGGGATVILPSGDYFVEELKLAANSHIIAQGDVRIFVKSAIEINGAKLNESGNGNLLLFGYDKMTLNGSSVIKANVYSDDDIYMNNTSTIYGRVTSRYLEMNASSKINDEAGGEPPLPAVPAQCPAEQDNVPGLTYRTYDARDWDDSGLSPEDHDDFEELLDDVRNTMSQIGESIVADINAKGLDINPHSSASRDQDHYVGVFEGYIDAPEDGEYIFAIDGDDAIELLIDDVVVTGFYGPHATCDCTDNQGKISLAKGTHKIELRFHEAFGHEAYRLYWQTPSQSSLTIVPAANYLTCPFPQFEFGRATLSASGSATISFENSYATPPVVVLMPTINGIDGTSANTDGPSSVIIDSFTATSVAIKQDEPPHKQNYNPVAKGMEEVDYFIMESGYRFLARGKALQAGKVVTKKYQGKSLPSSGRGYEEVDFAHEFGEDPVMIAQALTRNNSRFITVVIEDVDDDEFEIAIEASEISLPISNNETLGFVAGLGRGTMVINGESVLYEFSSARNHAGGNSTRTLEQQCSHPNRYLTNFPATPITIANKNSRKGADGGWVRRCLKESFNDRVSFVIDEDMHKDNERSHLAEDIGYFAFEYAAEPPATNHYRIQFSSDALSCTAKNITIKSCANPDCSNLSAVASSVVLTKDGERYSDLNFTGEIDTEVWHGEGGETTLGLGSTSPTGPYSCYLNDTPEKETTCTINFAEAGFIINIDNFLANKPQENIEITAVRKSDSSPQCEPTFASTSKVVNFWSEYVSPAQADIVTAKSISVNETNIGKSALNATPFTLAFDSQGKADFKLNYADAGRVALHAKYTATSGDDEGLVMEGSSNTVRYPVGLCIKPETTCSDGNASCDAFKVAGETFDMTIQAMAWEKDGDTDFCNNSTTPNYVQADIALEHILKQPIGGELGTLGLAYYDHIAKANSLMELEQFISEVGVFTLKATPPNSYLGEVIRIPSAESEPVGRFYPKDFEVYNISMLPACGVGSGAFNYMDQPVRLTMKVRARNSNAVVTQNYFGDFASSSSLLVGENGGSGTDLQARLDGLSPSTWSDGIQNVDNLIRFSRLLNSAVDGPYASMLLGLQMSDKDKVKIASADMNAGTVGDCATAASCNAKELTTQHYRHGRIILENAYGPEAAILRMPATAEFWNGTQWAVNSLDNCSAVVSSTLPATGVVYNPVLDAGQAVTRSGGAKFVQGRFELLWQSLIATPNRYRGQVTAPVEVPLWLQWYWNWDNDGALSDPRASAFFGTYRGHDKVIHWREVN